MPRNWSPLVALTCTLPLGTVPAARAQPAPATSVAPARPAPPRQPQTLQEVRDEIIWNPQQQGVLLLVAPGETRIPPERWRAIPQPDGTYTAPPLIELPARTDEGLRASQLEAYFGLKVVPCGDVTVLAPATMTVLNYKNLPKPSATSGLKPADSFRLLQASLSEAQWRQLAAPQGLGLADMADNDQRQFFLGSLPTNLVVQRTVNAHFQSAPLGPQQRQGIRMHMARQMNWDYPIENNGRMRVGFSSDGGGDAHVNVMDPQDMDWDARQRQAFGVELASRVPAFPKPGDLPFNWEALNTPIALDNLKTLGTLIDRIREQTRVEVYADPRYARLPLALRGDSARAGNLLKALAQGVTGTYRKVGPAYVLTDDLTGLAVRHALMQDWSNTVSGLAAQVDRKIGRALSEAKPDRFMGYDESDPLRPSDTLLKQYTEYQTSLNAPRKQGEPAPDPNKTFPVSALPPKMQEVIRQQVAEMQKGSFGDQAKKITGESVALSPSTVLRWDIPGVGVANAPYNTDVANMGSESSTFARPAPNIAPRPLPLGLKTRALILPLGKPDVLESAILDAKRAGFSELWLVVDPSRKTDQEALAQTVESARRAGLAARAVIRAGRRLPTKNTNRSGLDTNLLGETYTEYLTRALASGTIARPPIGYGSQNDANTPNPMEADARRQQERGDWLDPDSPEWTEAVTAAVQTVSATPGLAGIVLSDLVPPGYTLPDSNYYSTNQKPAGAQGGYTEARRLAFLRRFHVDPIDLSLNGGSGFGYGSRFRQGNIVQINLPFFPDYGPNAANMTLNGVNGSDLGTGNAWKEWNRLRGAAGEASLSRLQKSLNSSLPIWFYQNGAEPLPIFGAPFVVESRDKAPDATEKPAPLAPGSRTSPLKPTAAQRAQSSALLIAFDVAAMDTSDTHSIGPNVFAAMTAYLFSPRDMPLKNWDGLVLDMSGETLPGAATRLAILPTPTADTPATESTPPKPVPAKTPRPATRKRAAPSTR